MKGSKINGVEIKEDAQLCTKANVDSFTKEVTKLGVISNKSISLGSTYTND